MEFSAGLRGLHIHKVNEEMIVEVLSRHSLSPANLSQHVEHVYTPLSVLSHCRQPQLCTCTTELIAGLNDLQLDQFNGENDSQISSYGQFAAC